ncbi:MAG: 4-hydroxy-tetrahydrodipicolinate synthase [Elusimicrobium sp.]|jgi:4-hydroxy-tetrahydrodipicolinate synthase|nr:4-hydroxy-tetrahydrodipicolinate synthase [Elusimicrobium sp.]
MFNGVYTALITPFTSDDKIDFKALEKIIEAQIKAGVDGLVILGTTAETPCLTDKEKVEIVKFAKKIINGRIKMVVGAGLNSTVHTLETAKMLLPFDPDALLIVTPYYNKPNPSGLIAHFAEVGKLGKPIILYHVPGRTGLKVPLKVMAELVEQVPMLKAVKESEYDVTYLNAEAAALSDKIEIISGNDDMFPYFMALNGKGIISVLSNFAPKILIDIYKGKNAFKVYAENLKLMDACFYETNPTCVKYIMSRLGLCNENVRLPLGPVSQETRKKIDAVLSATDKRFLL